MDLDDAMLESRRRLLVVACVATAVACAVVLGFQVHEGASPGVLAVRVTMILAMLGIARLISRRRLAVDLAERRLVGGAWALALADLGLRLPTLGIGSAERWWSVWLAYTFLLLLAHYVVFPHASTRRSAARMLLPLYLLLVPAWVIAPVEGSVASTAVVPIVGLVLVDALTSRMSLLAQHGARSRAEAEAGRRDVLTGLPNRRGVLPALERVAPGDAMLLLDVDRFKQVNDEHGHETGDVVLRQVAARLRRECRTGDVVGRWGGEEFLLVARAASPDATEAVDTGTAVDVVDLEGAVEDGGRRTSSAIDAAAAIELAERLRRSVAAIDTPVSVTVSVGVAFVGPGDDWQDALRRADACLYEAKATGRDRVVHTPGARLADEHAGQDDGVDVAGDDGRPGGASR